MNSYFSAAVAPDGRIVVAEPNRIQVFEPDGKFASVFGVPRDVPDPYDWRILDVAVAPDGRIVVADRKGVDCPGANHVRILYPNETLAHSFAVDVGRCHVPSDVAVAPDGRIVVAVTPVYYGFEGEEEGVHIFSPLPDGTFARLPLNGTSYQPTGPNGTLVAVPGIEAVVDPVPGIAVAPNGQIVVGSGNHVNVFHSNGMRALTFGGHGVVPGGFDRPTDAAVAPDGRIVVAEPSNYTISVFHPNGTLDFAFGGHGHGDDAFYEPHQVAVAPDGRIVVGDTGKHRILVFEPDGTPALAFGTSGGGAGQIEGVRDMAVAPDGRIVVVDGGGGAYGRVQVFSPDGASVSELRGDVDYHDHWVPSSVATGPDGQIVVGNSDYRERNPQARVFNPNGTEAFVVELDWKPAGVAVAPDGRIVVAQGSRSQVFNPDGTFAFATEIDVDAVSVAVGPNREIVVVDNRHNRVQVFHPNGTFAFALLPDLLEGKFAGIGPIAVGPVMPPRPSGDPEPLRVAIEAPDGGGAPILRNFTNVGDAANVTIDVSGLVGPGGVDALNGSESSTVTFPTSETVVAASFAEVTFPPNVTASHVPEGGRLALRVATDVPAAEQVQAALGRSADGSGSESIVLLQSVVEVGAEGSRIMFDLPVRISLEGQAGGRAFYIEGGNGTIVPIDGACAADYVDAVHRQLDGAGECQMDSEDGTAKIVHTYHLTKFGTVSIEGPVPARTDAVDPPATPPPVVVVPPVVTGNGTFGGGGNATNGTAGPPTPPPVVPPPAVVSPTGAVDTCGVSIDFPALDMSARPGEYSEPVEQVVWNEGTLPLARVEIEATPWHDGSGPPVPPPLPGVLPPYSGPTEGRTAGAFTMYMIASLPASVTEVREGARSDPNGPFGSSFIGGGGDGSYGPLADGDGTGTVVLEGLEPNAEASLWFRLNLTPYDGLLAGALVQSITYQAECVPPTTMQAATP